MKTAVVIFPGSNCDRDMITALRQMTGKDPYHFWHKDTDFPKVDFIAVPGGFSYGDYLRCGAMAAHSPVMAHVKKHAAQGGKVLGVCNGFQILCEAGLLPGVLLRNKTLKFICKPVELRAANDTFELEQSITLPIAHGEGNYFIDAEGLKKLKSENRIVFRYTENPNGALDDIAGIMNETGNVIGMMPHPERAVDPLHGGTDGRKVFKYLLEV